MGGPALLQHLNAPIQLGEEPEHVILQSAHVIDGIHTRMCMDVGVLAHNDHPVYVLLELIERLEHLGIGVLLGSGRGLRDWLGLLKDLLRLIGDDRWNGNSDTQTTHQIINGRPNILCEYGGIGLLQVSLLIGVLLRDQEGIRHIKYPEWLRSLRGLRGSWRKRLLLLLGGGLSLLGVFGRGIGPCNKMDG